MSAPRHSADSYRDVLLDLVEVGAPTHAESVRRRSLGAHLLDAILSQDREARRLARLDADHAAAFDPQPASTACPRCSFERGAARDFRARWCPACGHYDASRWPVGTPVECCDGAGCRVCCEARFDQVRNFCADEHGHQGGA